MIGAVASTTPPKSMRDLLGIKDNVIGNGEDAQKQREKTAYAYGIQNAPTH